MFKVYQDFLTCDIKVHRDVRLLLPFGQIQETNARGAVVFLCLDAYKIAGKGWYRRAYGSVSNYYGERDV